MFDTHSHIQFAVFDKTRDQVIEDAKKIGVAKIIAVGTNLETSKKAIEVAEKYPEVFASVGIHPHHTFGIQNSKFKIQSLLKDIDSLIKNHKVVAIGETGMDKHIYENTKHSNYVITKEFIELQKIFFKEQIKLAVKFKKALIIHNREAVKETLEVLEKNWDKSLERKSVFHMCEPDIRLLNFAKEHNIFISFGGDITYDLQKQEFLKKVPLELLVLETDSPFFLPEPLRHSGERSDTKILNTPGNLNFIFESIIEILGMDKEIVRQNLQLNSYSLFNAASMEELL